jgi:hypothetical protein
MDLGEEKLGSTGAGNDSTELLTGISKIADEMKTGRPNEALQS